MVFLERVAGLASTMRLWAFFDESQGRLQGEGALGFCRVPFGLGFLKGLGIQKTPHPAP